MIEQIFLTIVILIFSIFLTYNASKMSVNGDEKQILSYDYIKYSYITGWIAVVVSSLMIAAIVYTGGMLPIIGKITKLVLIGSFLAIGILSSIGAYNMKKGEDYQKNKTYYTSTTWIASISTTIFTSYAVKWVIGFVKKTEKN